MENPFKFGTLVDEPYFTDREEELQNIANFLHSENHLILISPRRFGKSSLVMKVVKQSERPCVWVNMQSVLSKEDLAIKLLKAVFKQYKMEKVKHYLRSFRIIPSITTNLMNEDVSVSFQPTLNTSVILEDVFSLLEKISTSEHKLIVVLDEFQEILEIEKGLDKQLRAIMQEQKGLNYIFLGSQESMMTDIFEKVKSPFYHFGMLMRLDKIPYNNLCQYLISRLSGVTCKAEKIAEEILAFTNAHPYYTQQLAFVIWELVAFRNIKDKEVSTAIKSIVQAHDLDYERLWTNFNKTDKFTMITVCHGENPVQSRILPTSTLTSSLKRLMKKGYIIKTKEYEIEDPFFKKWIAEYQN